eukprot:6196957-Pleurochrysis_carterae.AAC.3
MTNIPLGSARLLPLDQVVEARCELGFAALRGPGTHRTLCAAESSVAGVRYGSGLGARVSCASTLALTALH